MCWYFSFEVTESCFEQIASYNTENDSSKESYKASSLLNLLGVAALVFGMDWRRSIEF